jgi:hypothetical protein
VHTCWSTCLAVDLVGVSTGVHLGVHLVMVGKSSGGYASASGRSGRPRHAVAKALALSGIVSCTVPDRPGMGTGTTLKDGS